MRPEIALGLSARSKACSCALALPGEDLHIAVAGSGSDMVATVAALFERFHLQPKQLEELRIDLGPGSYTGLRVAVTFARVVGTFHELRILAATSLELMVVSAWRQGLVQPGAIVRPVLDARRGRYHHATLKLEDKARFAARPRATRPEEMFDEIGPGEVLLAEEDLLSALEPRARAGGASLQEAPLYDARELFSDLLEPRLTDADDLQPLYLMGSYAEHAR